MPTIRIDEEVYSWLQSQAQPFEDTPNTVLRRLAKLNGYSRSKKDLPLSELPKGERYMSRTSRPITAKKLVKELQEKYPELKNINHQLYRETGDFYEILEGFPGVLFDYCGFKIFKTEKEYRNCPGVTVDSKTRVPSGISTLSDYKKFK